MHQNTYLQRRVPRGALVRLERSAAKVARCVLRGERSREAPDLPGGSQRADGEEAVRHDLIPVRGSSHPFSTRAVR
jgi:hypothetical protein